MSQGTNVLALITYEGEKYIFLYDDDPRSFEQLHNTLDQFVQDPELSFSQEDAETLSSRIPRVFETPELILIKITIRTGVFI